MKIYNYFQKLYHIIKNQNTIDVQTVPKTYYEELSIQCRRGALPASFISLFAYLKYISIDIVLHPEIEILPYVRLGLTISGLVSIVLYFIPYFKNKGILLWFIPAAYAEISSAWIVGITGSEPNYTVSFVLVIMLFAIVPFPIILSYGLLLFSIMTYYITDQFFGNRQITPSVEQATSTLRNTFIIITVFIYILDRLRYRSYLKSLTIEIQKNKTEKLLNMLDKEILLARKIQTSLLPKKITTLKEIDYSYQYCPVTKLGGDFIDLHFTNQNEIGIFICDVSGHGVPAALLSSMVKMSLSSWSEHIHNPAKLLSEIRESLRGKLTGHFISASICYIDLSSGKMKLASAGHLPLLILKKDSNLEILQPFGRIINDLFPTDCKNMEIQLNSGDKFILFTDGITEARDSEKNMYNESKLINLFTEIGDCDVSTICNKIIDDVQNHIGRYNDFQDDITLFVAEYKGTHQKV
jgi:hypothetical protein